MYTKIFMRDTKALDASIRILKKKIADADFDLTQQGVKSIANALLKAKGDIDSADGFAELSKVVKKAIEGYDTPKAKEIKAKIEELERMFRHDPRKGARNDLWLWEKLLKYVWNIILKASGNESPDVTLKQEYKERKEKKDSAMRDVVVYAEYKANQPGDFWLSSVEEGLDANDRFAPDKSKAHKFSSIAEAKKFCEEHGIEDFEIQDSACEMKDESLEKAEAKETLKELIRLIADANSNLIEASDLARDLEMDGWIDWRLQDAIDSVQGELSDFDFAVKDDPIGALMEDYGESQWFEDEEPGLATDSLEAEAWDE